MNDFYTFSYNILTDDWIRLPTIDYNNFYTIDSAHIVSYRHHIYIINSMNNDRFTMCFNPMINVWTRKAAIPLTGAEAIYRTIVINDKIHALTKRTTKWYLKTFDVEQNEWQEVIIVI